MKFDSQKTIFLIDGSSFLYRAYYGVRPLHTSKGEPVQAVYSFCRMIKKLIDKFNPQHIALVWDSKGKTTRHEMYPEYKATRQAPPSDLFTQKEHIVEFANMIGLKQIAQTGLEADDLMYSLAVEGVKEGYMVVLITSDKDMGQIVQDKVVLFDAFKDAIIDTNTLYAKMGFGPEKLPFYFALLGDASDNIPGVKGIGEKGATELVTQFASLEDAYNNLDKVAKDRTRNALQTNKENALLSQKLFLLQYNPTNLQAKDLNFDAQNWHKARSVFQELEFKSLIKEIDDAHGILHPQSTEQQTRLGQYNFKTVATHDSLQEVVRVITEKKAFAIDTETDGLLPLESLLVGLSICVEEGTSYYIPVAHKIDEYQLPKEQVVEALKPLFEDSSIKKYLHSSKFDQLVLHHAGLELNGVVFDTMVAANLVVQDWQRIGLKYLSVYYFNEPMLTFQEVVKDRNYKTFEYVPLGLATQYAAADAHQTFKLVSVLEQALEKQNVKELFYSIEMPLGQILYQMEIQGIHVNEPMLEDLNVQISKAIDLLEHEIMALTGRLPGTLNLNSPKQIEQLLFFELHLPPQKQTKGKSYSTDQEVLEALLPLHPIAALLLKYRELFKLKSTYIESLPEYINAKDGKIHTSYNQTSVTTGRLASSDPNLQNIPADATGFGRAIREAFQPASGHLFISADYSQIELRVLAFLSQDQTLLNAFKQGLDIHAQTAAGLFGVPLTAVTREQRQMGKRINFSILYGLTPYGLSKDMNITFSQAKEYIDKYFKQYPGVRAWMEKIVEETKKNGYVTTYWGKRRYIPAIYEKNRSLYEEARRIAINTVAQGTAAEIMKLGMINITKMIAQEKLDAYIVLQIHDELLLSVAQGQADKAQALITDILEHVVDWPVALEVKTRQGVNWAQVSK